MTFKEAKKILEKEGYELEKVGIPCSLSIAFTAYESPEICKAMQVVCSAGYAISIEMNCFNARKARLKKELEKYGNAPMPGPGEEQPKKGNPALKESASQFNDALLDEQAKKIKRLGKEISKLNSIIHDKNAVLSDVAEELRLTKIREKNLAELGLKYVGENEKLKKELAEKVVDKIDAQALKSAESALVYKEKVIAEKDEVIADLGNELAAFKESYKRRIKEDSEHFEHIQKICNAGLQKWLIESEYLEKDKPFCFPQLPDFSKEEEKKLSLFRDDSVGAVTNQKDCSPVKDTHPTEDNPEEVEMDEILERVRKALEKGHTVSIDYDKAEEGGDQSVTIVQCDNGIILSKEEAEIIERCTKNGMELHYSEKDGLTYTNVFGEEMPIRCLRGIFHVFTDEEIENMKK